LHQVTGVFAIVAVRARLSVSEVW